MGFAQNLAQLMQSKGLTKYQLAKKLECHQTSVTNWLENGTVPHKRTLNAIAALFDVSVEELCTDNLPGLNKEKSPTPLGAELTKESIQMLLDRMSAEDLSALIADAASELAKRNAK